MNFVTCDLIGPSETDGIHNYGLANQMFQIATALSYAEDNNLKAAFPQLLYDKFGPYDDNIFRNIDKSPVKEDEIRHEFREAGFEYIEIPKLSNIRLSGYFQSEKYFLHNRQLILSKFKPQDEILNYIQKKYGELLENSISLHVRIGDYKKIQDHHPLLSKTNYYQNVLKKSKRKNILVFSDNIKASKKIPAFKDKNIYFIEGESEIVDLYFMSLCTDNCIANSSFSWWGAWLNQNPNKIIYYPDTWFGPAKQDIETKDLFPASWLKQESKPINSVLNKFSKKRF